MVDVKEARHQIEVIGLNSIPMGSNKLHDTVYFNVIPDSIYWSDRANTKRMKRKIKMIDGKPTFKYNNIVYDLSSVI